MAAPLVSLAKLPKPIGRLAPSPTGTLHLGNARTFLLAWLSIRQQGGTLLLRMEDIDTPRVKAGAVQSALEDLRWLGFDWDYGPDLSDGSVGGIALTQSQRLTRYREVLESLVRQGRVYRCSCTRSQIAQATASAPHEIGLTHLEGPIYPGTCRANLQSAAHVDFSESDTAALRWAFEPGEASWYDQLLGTQSANPAEQLGDFVIGRASGSPSYQLAVVVDDHDTGVSEVVRGDDLMVSTFRQQAIIKQFGWQPPLYYHVPLVMDADGRRMAKRQGDSLSYFRQQQTDPRAIIGYLAYTLKLVDRPRAIAPIDLVGKLDWNRIPLAPTRFNGRLDGSAN